MNATLRFTHPPRFDVTATVASDDASSGGTTVRNVPAYEVRPLVESWLRLGESGCARKQIDSLRHLTELDVRLRTTGLDYTAASHAAALGVHIQQVPA